MHDKRTLRRVVGTLLLAAFGGLAFAACSAPTSDAKDQLCRSDADCVDAGVGFLCEHGACRYAGIVGGYDGGILTYPDGGVSTDASLGEGGDAAVNPADPHGAQRRALVAAYCARLERYSCLDYKSTAALPFGPDATPAEKAAFCRSAEDVSAYWSTDAMGACWGDWAALAACAGKETYTCPCADAGHCALEPILGGAACKAEQTAYAQCVADNTTKRTVQGTKTRCSWTPAAGDVPICHVACIEVPSETFTADCLGIPDSSLRCSCALNGVVIADASGGVRTFYAGSCETAARALANGECGAHGSPDAAVPEAGPSDAAAAD